MRIAIIVVLSLLAGALLGASARVGPPKATAPAPASPNVRTLLETELDKDFTPGRDVIVDLVHVPPGTSLQRHWHPGEEFHYYLDGDVRIEIEGEPTIVGKPGTVGHVPYKKLHRAVAGPKGANILVFRVHTHGEPWRTMEAKPDSGS